MRYISEIVVVDVFDGLVFQIVKQSVARNRKHVAFQTFAVGDCVKFFLEFHEYNLSNLFSHVCVTVGYFQHKVVNTSAVHGVHALESGMSVAFIFIAVSHGWYQGM